MIFRLLGLFLIVALGGLFAQDELPGVFGKIASRPRAGDLAPEIRFSKVLSNAGLAPWTSASLSGRVTVLFPFPYVSGNPNLVSRWNALVESFANEPIQFAWIAGEREDTLLPFLQKHPLKGWFFSDPDGATGRAYGLEMPEAIIVGADRRITGFDRSGAIPSEELINAVLQDRITISPPRPTSEQLRALSENGQLLLWPEPQRMSRAADYHPDFAPSYAVHIAPAHHPQDGGNYGGPDYWNLQGYTVPMLLSEVLGVNPVRIVLPASVDTKIRYDFAIVLPKPEDRESMRSLVRQGVQDYFHLAESTESRLRDVYLLTVSDKNPPVSRIDPNADDGFTSSSSIGFMEVGGRNDAAIERAHDIAALTTLRANNATMDELCGLLESELDRLVVNETGLQGRFDFKVSDTKRSQQELPKRDFVERLRDQLGLIITPAQRDVDTTVYRAR